MPRYRVREGSVLPHNGVVLEGGAVLELPRAIGQDMAVSHAVEEIDDRGQAVAPTPIDDLERFRTHERVGILRDRIAEAQGRVDALTAQLAAEERTLAAEVRAIEKRPAKEQPQAAAPAAVKE